MEFTLDLAPSTRYNKRMKRRFDQLAASVAFLLLSIAVYHAGVDYLHTKTQDSPAGVWKQYVEYEGETFYLATFRFDEHNHDFQVECLDVSPMAYPQSGFRTFGHYYDGTNWMFHSDWHEHGVALFQLTQVEDGRFEGWAYLHGKKRPYKHILVRAE